MNLTNLSLSFWDYALETVTRILNMVPTKKVDKTPYMNYGYPNETMGYYFYFPPENKIVVARYAEFLEKNLLSQEVSGRAKELEKIQDKDRSPSRNISKIPMEVEGFEPPQEEVVLVRSNYKAALLDPKSNKWVDAMNAEIQSMKDNQVWCLVDLPPNCKTVGSKWLFLEKYCSLNALTEEIVVFKKESDETHLMIALLKVSPWKGVIRFGKWGKLNPCYIGPFKILAKVGIVIYRLELPEQLSRVPSTVHVSKLKKCMADEPLDIPLDEIQVDDKLNFIEEPVEIMDREVKRLKQSRIPIVKVRWNSKRGHEFTWEREDQMQKKYPHLFPNSAPMADTTS
nr:putative reverse transcriptase domain-containing protein [Tanacetum cinerariifolium]